LFGIHTGTVYPEIMNLVEDISQKSKRINTKDFNCCNELNYTVLHLEKELDYYIDYLVYCHEKEIKDIEDSVFYVEKVVNSYRIGLIKFVNYEVENKYNDIDKNNLKQVIDQYNKVIVNFIEGLKMFEINGFSDLNLLITYEGEYDK
jgi:hypothetical protein